MLWVCCFLGKSHNWSRSGHDQLDASPNSKTYLNLIRQDNGRDQDKDGLTDIQEMVLGTNRSETISRTYLVDTVGPVITVTTTLTER